MMDPLPKALTGSSLSDASSAEAARDADEVTLMLSLICVNLHRVMTSEHLQS
jgi:hypothetical protein